MPASTPRRAAGGAPGPAPRAHRLRRLDPVDAGRPARGAEAQRSVAAKLRQAVRAVAWNAGSARRRCSTLPRPGAVRRRAGGRARGEPRLFRPRARPAHRGAGGPARGPAAIARDPPARPLPRTGQGGAGPGDRHRPGARAPHRDEAAQARAEPVPQAAPLPDDRRPRRRGGGRRRPVEPGDPPEPRRALAGEPRSAGHRAAASAGRCCRRPSWCSTTATGGSSRRSAAPATSTRAGAGPST